MPYTVADVAGKDSRQAASTLGSDVAELLAAIVAALNVPFPTHPDDTARALVVLENRCAAVTGAVSAVLECGARPGVAVEPIRSGVRRHPVTYPTYRPAGGTP